MKAVLTINMLDDVSGTTIFDDGTKAFWSEGRSSSVYYITAAGERWSEPVWVTDPSGYMTVLSGDGIAYGPMRGATQIEELEHWVARNDWRI